MSEAPTLDGLAPAKRDVLRGLARGQDPDAIGRDVDRTPEEVLELAQAATQELAGDLDDVGAGDRAAIADYVLGRQSPGQAAGTWRLLEGSDPATAWAQRLRTALDDVGRGDPVALPSDDDALSPTQRARRRPAAGEGGSSLAERRKERSRRRTAASAQQAAAELMSPFRSEAIDAQKEADDRIELPQFAPRPVQYALYGLLAILLVGLAFCVFVRIPVNTNAIVLITDIPQDAPGTERGLSVLALFPEAAGGSGDVGSGADVHRGDTLRVALPGEEDRTPVRVRWVSDGPVAARQVIDAYRLPLGQANRVATPGYVAQARLVVPDGKRPGEYEGTTTTEASVETGSRRIISLLF